MNNDIHHCTTSLQCSLTWNSNDFLSFTIVANQKQWTSSDSSIHHHIRAIHSKLKRRLFKNSLLSIGAGLQLWSAPPVIRKRLCFHQLLPPFLPSIFWSPNIFDKSTLVQVLPTLALDDTRLNCYSASFDPLSTWFDPPDCHFKWRSWSSEITHV